MVFEKAAMGNVSALTALRLDFLEEDFGGLTEPQRRELAERLPDYFFRHLGKDLFAWLAREEDTPVACAFLQVTELPAAPAIPTGLVGTVLNVYTAPAYRRQGVALRVMGLLLEDAQALGLDRLELKATPSGYGLYRKLGFTERTQHRFLQRTMD